MKIGILTFHSGQNYGASLQAYALRKYLSEKGADVEVIDFRKEKVFAGSKVKSYFAPARILRKAYEAPYKKSLAQKSKRFDQFLSTYVIENTQPVANEENIGDIAKQYDAILFGSDQIWNTDPRVYDRSKVFFGDFPYTGKKFSYAASFGDSILRAKNNGEYIVEKLKDFKTISVRESTGKVFLEESGIHAACSVDPTMLLDKNAWKSLINEKPIIDGKYILYYSVNCRKYSWEVAKQISKRVHLPVYNLVAHPKIIRSGFRNYYSGGPLEFLNILHNAEYVVTNSFHGVIFSIVFNKKFIPVFSEKDGKLELEERKYSILQLVGLDDLVTSSSRIHTLDDYCTINWTDVNDKRMKLVDDSQEYLKSVLRMI